jgi:dolichol kinase
VKYLINWVAGTKLFFISLLAVILFFGTPDIYPWVLLAMIFSIASFYIGLYPLAQKIDNEDMLNPKGYSKTLAGMITIFIIVFLILYLWPFIIPYPMPSFW